MLRDDEQLERAKPEATGLESYRRLILLQKQMIELSQRHEQSKRQRDALRDSVARAVAEELRARRSLRYRWQRKLIAWWRQSQNFKLKTVKRFCGRLRATPSASN